MGFVAGASLLILALRLAHLDERCKESKSHGFSKLPFGLEHSELLLLIRRDLVLVITSDPWMLKSSDGIIAQRGRIAAQIEEKVLGEGRKACREVKLEWMRLNFLELLIIIFACYVAWVLPTSE